MNQAAPARAGALADPFGLWSLQPIESPSAGTLPGEMTSFGLPAGGGAGEPETAAPAWQLDLVSGPEGPSLAQQALDRRAGQVQNIFFGLEQAFTRSQALLDARAVAESAQAAGGPVSFSIGSESELPDPEAWLSGLLDQVQAPTGANVTPSEMDAEAVSFGLGQNLANLAGAVKGKRTGAPTEALPVPGWEDMQRNFTQLMDSVDRQLLHFCRVETTLDGQQAACTEVDWHGNMITLWMDGLTPEQSAAHRRSLELAMQSRVATLKTVMTVAQVAGKLVLAVSTPQGPMQAAQALVVGWKFISSVVMPLLK